MQEAVFKVKICGEDSPKMAAEAAALVNTRISEKEYSIEDVDYIQKLKLKLVEGGLNVSENDLEKLRHLCKLWDVELKPTKITSHRAFLGPIIVAIKKLLFPIVRIFLKDSFKQQRDFNAAAVSMLADLLNRKAG